MNQTALTDAVAAAAGITRKEAAAAVNAALEAVASALAAGEKVILPGFGTFEVRQRAALEALNPRTGELIPINEKKDLSFRPSKALKERVNGSSPARQ